MAMQNIRCLVVLILAGVRVAVAGPLSEEPTPGDYLRMHMGNAIQSYQNLQQANADFEHELKTARTAYFSAKPGSSARKTAQKEYAELLYAKDVGQLGLCIGDGYPACWPRLAFFKAGGVIDEESRPWFGAWVNSVRESLPQRKFGDVLVAEPESLQKAVAAHTKEYFTYANIRDKADARSWHYNNPTPEYTKKIINPCNKQAHDLVGDNDEAHRLYETDLFNACLDNDGILPEEKKTWYRDVAIPKLNRSQEVQTLLNEKTAKEAAKRAEQEPARHQVQLDCDARFNPKSTVLEERKANIQCVNDGFARIHNEEADTGDSLALKHAEVAAKAAIARANETPQERAARQTARANDRKAKIGACSGELHAKQAAARRADHTIDPEMQRSFIIEFQECMRDARTGY